MQFCLKLRAIKYMYQSREYPRCQSIIILARDNLLYAYHEDWRLRIRRWRRRHATHSTSREILTDPRRCSIIAIIGRFTDSVRLPWKLSGHITLTEEESTAASVKLGNLEEEEDPVSHSLITKIFYRDGQTRFPAQPRHLITR